MRKNRLKLLKYLFHTMLSFALLILSISFALFTFMNSTFIYKLFIYMNKSNINCSLPIDTIYKNYKILINYITSIDAQPLYLPNFQISSTGSIHFFEVKQVIFYIFLLSVVSGIFIIIYLLISKIARIKDTMLFIKIFPILTLSLSIVLSILFLINFDKCFEVFHKIVFNNSYWLFDPKTDPIITVLPEEFFSLGCVYILSWIIIESICCIFLYRSFNKSYINHNTLNL